MARIWFLTKDYGYATATQHSLVRFEKQLCRDALIPLKFFIDTLHCAIRRITNHRIDTAVRDSLHPFKTILVIYFIYFHRLIG